MPECCLESLWVFVLRGGGGYMTRCFCFRELARLRTPNMYKHIPFIYFFSISLAISINWCEIYSQFMIVTFLFSSFKGHITSILIFFAHYRILGMSFKFISPDKIRHRLGLCSFGNLYLWPTLFLFSSCCSQSVSLRFRIWGLAFVCLN